MTPFLKKYWPLLIAAAVLLFIALRSCNPVPSHKEEKKGQDSMAVQYKADKAKDLQQIAALNLSNYRLKYQLDSTQILLAFTRKDAAGRIEAVKNTLASGADAARRRDTAAIIVNWDSLRAQVVAGLPVITAEDSLSQRVIADCLQQGMVKDSLIYAYKDLWQKADTAYTRSALAYNGLYVDYTRLNRQFKFNKTLSRGLAIILLVAGAKIFIFK
jgi:hypothetical protein